MLKVTIGHEPCSISHGGINGDKPTPCTTTALFLHDERIRLCANHASRYWPDDVERIVRG